MIQWLYKWLNQKKKIAERKIALMERAKVGLSTRANDAVIREAKEHYEMIFIQVRKSDGMILCNQNSRMTLYSRRFVTEHPQGAASTMKWVALDPDDFLDEVDFDDDGCWYYRGGFKG